MNLASETHKLAIGSTSDVKDNVDFVLDAIIEELFTVRFGVVVIEHIHRVEYHLFL
jgi:hypothetical protein